MSGTDSDIDLCYKAYDNIHEANNHGSPTKIGVTARNMKTDPAFRKLKLLLFDDLFGIKTKKVHKKMSYLRAGFDYDHRGNRRYLFTLEEKHEIVDAIIKLSAQHDCLERRETQDIATEIIARRDERYVAEKRVSLQTIDNICKRHGILQKRPISTYQRKATPSKTTVQRLYENISTLFTKNHYRRSLIFNMDELWVAHQDKAPRNNVLYPLGDKPHRQCAQDAEHITLVGCIAADGTFVSPAFIVKKGLNQENKIDQYDLSLYPIHNNLSGFMDGKALLWWVKEVFLPEVVRRRKIVGNLPVVLFWDAHSTRTNVAVRQWLQFNGVDIVILQQV